MVQCKELLPPGHLLPTLYTVQGIKKKSHLRPITCHQQRQHNMATARILARFDLYHILKVERFQVPKLWLETGSLRAYAGTKANSIPRLFKVPKWSLRSAARECCLRIEANVADAHNVVSELQRTDVSEDRTSWTCDSELSPTCTQLLRQYSSSHQSVTEDT
ncbi:hypothetical protein Baya_8937 [Bagarius yarrelli]|uniref:Uncharacterized protein n=1 Tax=Bagarius yarrelli TaxID=175774 RepID=A0A556U7M8_BAGYA|nr:hypothetical protein Baya_8937 [Bagarius yarrelli]